MRYFFIEADREDRTWVQRLATFVPLDIDVVDLHVLRFQLIDDGTDVPERIELHVQIDVTRVLLYVRIHNWEQADAEKYHRECDEHALVKSCADRKAGAGRRPQTSGSGQALDLLAAGNENGSCAQKADAVDDLCAETRNVGFYADLCANIRPRPCHHGKFVQAEQHGQRRAKTDEHIGAETGRTALASALQTDAAAEQHRKGEPHYDRGEMKFAQVLYHSTHLM